MATKEYKGLLLLQDGKLPTQNQGRAVVHHIATSHLDFSEIVEKFRAYSQSPHLAYIHFSLEEKNSQLLQNELRAYENQIKGINARGLHFLSLWLNEAIQETFHRFPTVAADEFQLEASLRQYDIEVNSLFLRKRLEELDPYNIDRLGELNRLLAIKFVALEEIKKGIERIITAHPELHTIYQKIAFFHQVLLVHLVGRENNLHDYFLFEKSLNIQPILIGSPEEQNIRDAIGLWLHV